MAVFQHYARYYDLLYKDKDYPAEIAYISGLIDKYQPEAKTILDLGCGTGRHACLLADKGFEITGVDFSESMISLAQSRKQHLTPDAAKRIHFQKGDIRRINLGRQFDVVLSLFHVFSYLTTNDDLKLGFQTVYKHLRPGGLFLFDFWYGPAVLEQRPQYRKKELSDDVIEVERIARPEIHLNDNIVDVNYELAISDKTTGKIDKVHEQHRMRYLFLPEIRQFLLDASLELIFSQEWMTGLPPGSGTWGVCCGARKTD